MIQIKLAIADRDTSRRRRKVNFIPLIAKDGKWVGRHSMRYRNSHLVSCGPRDEFHRHFTRLLRLEIS